MSRLIVRWILLAVSLILAAQLTDVLGLGFRAYVHDVPSFLKLLVGVAFLSFLNATLGAVLKFMTLPLNCMTFGLVSLVINAAMLQIAGSIKFGFVVENFFSAFVGSLLLSAVNGILSSVFVGKDERDD
jgi:putative membrane protein